MSINKHVDSNRNLKNNKWPPDFSHYMDRDLSKSNLFEIFNKEAQNVEAPEAYKLFFSQLAQQFSVMTEKINQDQQTIEQLQSSCEKYSQYVQAARENYEQLSELYKEQHSRVLDLQESQIQLQLQIESEKKQHEQMTAELRQNLSMVEKEKADLYQDFEHHKAEAAKNAEKQGLGRRNLEEILLEKEGEIDELQRKTNELRETVKHKEKEVEDVNTKYKAITTLLQGTRHMQQQQQQQQQNPMSYS
ncbi:hypothetical protein G6F46_012824 [Rhizopus delemar]|uniref:Uncharacterized protein n=3 Tax=Rhizopus TaxID=4842 RepID=I1BNF2_RHIO9|nr:hypothetical protein RO3G_02436 [Rhizopus delemar RA 99-880]KAG1443071.1 hypothetical protein G6F55_012779 [Rhizopus delemar]KAG1538675.1 hypothetical protein G6F51_009620 [Rhizopus arrhizus]KAG1487328.1 hypothetical protein G6F54_012725 [Rhizopus delemar]KAG1493336.1 hypothetical protein G6F53_012776 [Rhizopus delemar]|eukprot:EIE77732.1 hypothetical protein RO3G_02436 [Rhizopus delemar RA 99-880]